MLHWAVIVGTVRERSVDTKTTHPGLYQQVRSSLGAGVGARGMVGGFFGELKVGLVYREVAVHFIGRDVVEAFAMLSHCLKNSEGTYKIRMKERPWVLEAIVIVAFSGKMYHNIRFANQLIHKLAVANVALYKGNLIEWQIVGITRIGE